MTGAGWGRGRLVPHHTAPADMSPSHHSFSQTPFSAPWSVLGWCTNDRSLPLLLFDKVWVKRRESTRQFLGRKGLDSWGGEPCFPLSERRQQCPGCQAWALESCFIHQTVLCCWERGLGRQALQGSSKPSLSWLQPQASASGPSLTSQQVHTDSFTKTKQKTSLAPWSPHPQNNPKEEKPKPQPNTQNRLTGNFLDASCTCETKNHKNQNECTSVQLSAGESLLSPI